MLNTATPTTINSEAGHKFRSFWRVSSEMTNKKYYFSKISESLLKFLFNQYLTLASVSQQNNGPECMQCQKARGSPITSPEKIIFYLLCTKRRQISLVTFVFSVIRICGSVLTPKCPDKKTKQHNVQTWLYVGPYSWHTIKKLVGILSVQHVEHMAISYMQV